MSNLTERAIKASFLRLLQEQPLKSITVREITEDCGINRNSFYYHYHDIPELIEEILKDEVAALIASYPGISSLEECVEAVFEFISENRRSINHIYHSVDREILEKNLMQVCEYTISTWYDNSAASLLDGMEHGNKNHGQILRFLRYELFGACIDFMNEGMPPGAIEDAKELLHLAMKLL